MAKIKQSGAVSIFAVIFSTLLLTVLTVGFIRLMISGQQQAINNDLSQSAYDSAMAGVEDAKRVVRACQMGSSSEACAALTAEHDCRVVIRSGIVVADSAGMNEIMVRTNSGSGDEFDQAYTCVNIDMNTPDYVYEAATNQPRLIPLRSTGDFDRVTIEWFTLGDLESGHNLATPSEDGGSAEGYRILPRETGWGANTPPVLRVQVITPGVSFDMESLDDSQASQTRFFRPGSVMTGSPSSLSVEMGEYQRRQASDPQVVSCSADFQIGSGYSCRVTLILDEVSQPASENAFLNISAIYNTASVRVSLSSGASPVQFEGVQPIVDSTGRANDLFRRVEARLELGDRLSYPRFGVDVAGNLCKDFSLNTEQANPGGCQP